jgi:hypothetical protein
MINLAINPEVSSIFLTVTLLIYLLVVELGEERTKKTLFAPILILLAVFAFIAIKYLVIQFTI